MTNDIEDNDGSQKIEKSCEGLTDLLDRASLILEEISVQLTAAKSTKEKIEEIYENLARESSEASASVNSINGHNSTASKLIGQFEAKSSDIKDKLQQAAEQFQELSKFLTQSSALKDEIEKSNAIVVSKAEEVSALENASAVLVQSVEQNVEAIKSSFENFKVLETETDTQIKKCNKILTELETQLDASNDKVHSISSIESDVRGVQSEIKSLSETANQDVEKIAEARIRFEENRTETDAEYTSLQASHAKAAGQIEEVRQAHASVKASTQNISDLHRYLFEDQKDDEGEVTEFSIEKQIFQGKEKFDEILSEQAGDQRRAKLELEELKSQLEQEIRSLLPSAGAAGLASAYFEAKSKYGIRPFESDAVGWPRRWEQLIHSIENHGTTVVYYSMFLVPLAAMLYIYLQLFAKYEGGDINYEVILFRALITIPCAVISFFGWSSIRLSRRLYEEYNHKQRVMELYHSFKDEVDQHGTSEHKHALLSVMLKAVDDKPSLAMNKDDKSLSEFLPALGLGALFGFKKTDKSESASQE